MVFGLVLGITALLALLSEDVIGYIILPIALIFIVTPAIGRMVRQGD